MSNIYFADHQKRQLVDFLKKYPRIFYVKNFLEFAFEKNQNYQCFDTQIQ